MIEGLKPYPEYEKVKVPWVDALPSGWRLQRGRGVFECVDIRSRTGSEELLSVSATDGVRRRSEKAVTMFQASSYAGHKLAWPGDLVINSLWAWMKGLGFSKYHGIVSTAYGVYRPRPEQREGWRYFNYLFRSSVYDWELRVRSKGIWVSRMQLTDWSFLDMPVVLPPPNEQAAIVRFLDYANRKIDRFIHAKRKMIALLNEQKQAIIHQAVTRGLTPDVKLKPSGIPWLGDIPEHWAILRAKYVYREIDERSTTGNEEQLSVSHLTGVTPRSEKSITMFKAASYVGHKVCRPGDLAINTMWAWMAALGVSRHEGVISPAYAVYRQRSPKRLLGNYADLLLRTAPYKSNYLARSTGVRASRLRLYPEEFFKIPIIIPPIEEQQQIVDSITAEIRTRDTAIARTEREIALMQEYRTRLTADIVTGKLDVREAAAKLPEIEDTAELPTEILDEDILNEAEMEEVNE